MPGMNRRWLTQSHLRTNDFAAKSIWESRGIAAVAIPPALLAIYALDRVTETAPIQHLYYLPIIYAGIAFGRAGGLGAAVASIALYHLANHAPSATPYGELDVLQIVLFLLVAVVSAKVAGDA